MSEQEPSRWQKIVVFCREHPYMVTLVIGSSVAGAIGATVLPIGESLPMARRVLGGAVVGFYFGLLPLGFRLFE